MPGSSFEGKQAGRQMLATLHDVHKVVDVGPGHGTWRFWTLLWNLFTDAEWTALEIWEPYVKRYRLGRWYDRVIVGDASADIGWPRYDLAIFGDVVEHLPRDRAVAMVLRLPWRYALISIPLGPYPQGPSEGNPHEAHLSTWSADEVCAAFPVVKWSQEGAIGVFLLHR